MYGSRARKVTNGRLPCPIETRDRAVFIALVCIEVNILEKYTIKLQKAGCRKSCGNRHMNKKPGNVDKQVNSTITSSSDCKSS
jgi:hypothetical protein